MSGSVRNVPSPLPRSTSTLYGSASTGSKGPATARSVRPSPVKSPATSATGIATPKLISSYEYSLMLIGAMAWNVLAMSIGGMAVYNFMMDRYGAAKAASGFFLVPGASALIAWLLIDEHLKPIALIGLIASTVGVVLVWWKPRAAAQATP